MSDHAPPAEFWTDPDNFLRVPSATLGYCHRSGIGFLRAQGAARDWLAMRTDFPTFMAQAAVLLGAASSEGADVIPDNAATRDWLRRQAWAYAEAKRLFAISNTLH